MGEDAHHFAQHLFVTDIDVQVGEATGDEPMFIIADLSNVWVELDLFSRDLGQVRVGQNVTIQANVTSVLEIDSVWVEVTDPTLNISTHYMTNISQDIWQYNYTCIIVGEIRATIVQIVIQAPDLV